jgi:pimeloyl-ACP methyl ester carboxylesterase
MPYCSVGDANLYYEVHGSGYPVLLIAPGGMNSAIPLWSRAPWNPVPLLSRHYQVILMDQRNAGRSFGSIRVGDGWHTYLADQLALLDQLGIARFHVGGMCIGGAFALALAALEPSRVSAGLLMQPIGLDDNRQPFFDMYDGWADSLRLERTDVASEAWSALREALYGGDFVFAIDRASVRRCATPLLVLAGDDLYHPYPISVEIADLAPAARRIDAWKSPEAHSAAQAAVLDFFAAHG